MWRHPATGAPVEWLPPGGFLVRGETAEEAVGKVAQHEAGTGTFLALEMPDPISVGYHVQPREERR